MRLHKLLPVVLMTALLTLTACGGGSDEMIAPDFTIELLDGSEFTLSDHQGEVVILNFWATWCGPCVGEIPELEKLAENYADQGVYVLAVNCSEDEEKVRDFVDDREVTLNVGLDPEMDVQSKYPTNGIPFTVFVNSDGMIAHAVVGVHPEDHYGYLTEKLDAILAGSEEE